MEGYVSTNHSGSLGTQRRHRTLGFSPPKDLGILGFLRITWWRGTFNAEPTGEPNRCEPLLSQYPSRLPRPSIYVCACLINKANSSLVSSTPTIKSRAPRKISSISSRFVQNLSVRITLKFLNFVLRYSSDVDVTA